MYTAMRLAITLPLLFLLIGVLIPARAAAQPATFNPDDAMAAGKRLLAAGDSLADKADIKDAEVKYVRGFQLLLGGMRGLPFKHPVKYRVITRAEAAHDLAPEDTASDKAGMEALGLLAPSIDLKKVLTGVRDEQVAAYYNEHTKIISLIVNPQKAKAPPTFLQKLMGQKSGFSKAETRTTIAHELTHAQTDQYYQLGALEAEVKSDDDRDYALHALAEGDATLAMMLVNTPGSAANEITLLQSRMDLIAPVISLLAGGSLGSAPAVVRDTMLFPYMAGMSFCARLFEQGGWSAVNDAYTNPPLSTSEILHPDLYRKGAPAPMAFDLAGISAGPGWRLADHNDVGEMQIGILLSDYDGKQAATGWNGDAFDAFKGPGGRLGLAWISTWNSEDDAAFFAQHYLAFQTDRFRLSAPPAADTRTAVRPPPFRLLRERSGVWYAAERRGVKVGIVEGFSKDTVLRLLDRLFAARMSPKRPLAPSSNTP